MCINAQFVGLSADFIFMEDNDPKHIPLNTSLWLLYNTLKVLQTPPQSPDINPIEYLWEELRERKEEDM